MRLSARVVALGSCIWLAGQALAPPAAHAGVPRSCVYPRAHPLECPREMRRVLHRMLPSSRLAEQRAQRPELEREAPLEDRERNRLLREIRGELRR